MHQVGAALRQRLQLGLSLKLSDATGAGEDPEAIERIAQAVTYLQYAHEHFLKYEALSEAVAAYEHIAALQTSGDSSRPVANALSAQMEVINTLRPSPTQATRTLSSLQIRVGKPESASSRELEEARGEAAKWFADYHRSLEILIEAAQSVEGGS